VGRDCTVGKLSECNEAGDKETVDIMSYVYRVGVAQPQSELHSHDRSWMCGVGNGCPLTGMGSCCIRAIHFLYVCIRTHYSATMSAVMAPIYIKVPNQ
jgi:hypothetical protein